MNWDFSFDAGDLRTLQMMMGEESIALVSWHRISEFNVLMANHFANVSESNKGKRVDSFEREVHSTTKDFVDCLEFNMKEYATNTKETYFLRTIFARYHECLRQSWKSAIHDGAYADFQLNDSITSASDIVGGAKGTVYNHSGWMLNAIKNANVKDRGEVRNRFVNHNTMSLAAASDDSRLVTCIVDEWEHKAGMLLRPGRTFYDFVLNVEAHYKANLSSKELAARCLADLPRSIDTIVRKSAYLRNRFRSCFPSDFNTNEELLMWDIYDRVLIKYSKMRAKDYSTSQQAVYRPNGGYTETDDFSTRQAVKIASIVAKSNDVNKNRYHLINGLKYNT
jgi:hypothetical protein